MWDTSLVVCGNQASEQKIENKTLEKQNKTQKANMEPERQSLDLHRLPNQTKTIRIRTANRWAYIHILTHKNKQTPSR